MASLAPDERPTPMVGTATKLGSLEYLRGLAAFYVFLHHVAHINLKPHFPVVGRIFLFGQVAVMLFFILSGFVVYYSAVGSPRGTEPRPYLIRRFRRIYPPFVVAIGVGWIAGLLRGSPTPSLWELVGNLMMLQDRSNHPGALVNCFAGNSPLWSLSYEWWFYLLFLALFRTFGDRPERLQYLAFALSASAFGLYQLWPNQPALFVSYFMLWWSGAELAREYMAAGRITLAGQLRSFAFVGAITLGWAVVLATSGRDDAFEYPTLQLRHTGSVFLMLVGGFAWYRLGYPGFRLLFRPFGVLAPISYALYVVHEPILEAARDLTPGSFLGLAIAIPLIFAIAWLTEKPLQNAVNRWLPTR